MRLIGGVLLGGRAGDPAAVVSAMARAVPGTAAPQQAVRGRAGLFACLAPGALDAGGEPWVVADTELVNWRELEASVGAAEPASVLSALYARDGRRFVERLRGGFAAAVWDPRAEELVLAVDRLGIRRLYYAVGPTGFAFASRAAALRACPGIDDAVDPGAVYLYLNFGFVPAPHTVFRGIRRLPPGHVLRVGAGRPTLTRYWDLTYPERPVPLREAAARTFGLLEHAVSLSLHGVGVKETGAFLSGGTDSSTVLGLIGRLTGERPQAFSVGFAEPSYDERRYAELAARHFGARHEVATLTPADALAVLPRLVEAYDEPFGNDSTLATYACVRLARECGMVRLLAGDGGDELFGGNERYRVNQIFASYGRIPPPLRRALIEPALGALPDGGRSPLGRAQRYVRRARIPNPRRFYSYEFYVAQQASELLAPDFAAAVDLEAPWRLVQEHFDRAEASSELNRLLYLDLKLAIGDNDLLKVTRAAEAAGVEVRFPMLDHPLAEFTGTLPVRYKVRGLEKRYLFKRAFRELLPAAVLAKRKHGFGVPVSEWLRTHEGFRALAGDTLFAPAARTRDYLRPDAVARLARLHATDVTPYYGGVLWTLLMLELWLRAHGPRRVA